MQRIRVLGVAFVALFAFSAIAAAGASAHKFTTSVEKTLFLAVADGEQTFVTLAGTLKCTELKGDGKAEELSALAQKAIVEYKNCKAITSHFSVKPNEPIVAEYEFNADGDVKVLAPITIVATLGTKCTITVPGGQLLFTIKYDPKPKTAVLVLANVTNIETSAKGAGCTEEYETSAANAKTGTYVGNAETFAELGGEIGWE
jgi:hypothetical protein